MGCGGDFECAPIENVSTRENKISLDGCRSFDHERVIEE